MAANSRPATASTGIHDAIADAAGFLRDRADPASAPGRKQYLKTPLKVLGCAVPDVRRAAKTVRRVCPSPDIADLEDALRDLWQSDWHDDRVLATMITQVHAEKFDARHVSGLFHDWLGEATTWDIVDSICTFTVGHIALNHPSAWKQISAWTADPWMWRRRASVLCHIPAIRAGQLDETRLRKSCDILMVEKEFFIRKAIGWTIREISDIDPGTAEKMIAEMATTMSGLTFREASRKLPAHIQARLKKKAGR